MTDCEISGAAYFSNKPRSGDASVFHVFGLGLYSLHFQGSASSARSATGHGKNVGENPQNPVGFAIEHGDL